MADKFKRIGGKKLGLIYTQALQLMGWGAAAGAAFSPFTCYCSSSGCRRGC